MNRYILKEKKVNEQHLKLESLVSDHDFPGQEVYALSLDERPGIGHESSGVLLLTPPDAYMLSKAAYEAIFDAIKCRNDFFELREALKGKLSNTSGIIYNLVHKSMRLS